MARDRIVLDSGALSTLADESRSLRIAFRHIVKRHAPVVVPTVVIAEATTGDHRRDANVNHALKSASLIGLDARIARSAALLRHAHRRSGAGTIDAIVVATADVVPGTRVLTSDPHDLRLLASVNGRTRIIDVNDAGSLLS